MTVTFDATLARLRRSQGAVHVALLAVLAYLPTITAAPGRMPSDTKLYLYLDPARLTSDALSTWDARQFAGWVPHQTLSYLWPSGPWYSFFSWIGAPDWVAHRLWLGTLLFTGGLGVRWAAKHLGIVGSGALVAALFYQLSPYVLPYVSRTSAMLLPWAGLGWLVGLTIRAATRTRWRDVAIFGLVMLTVAAPNATAILMIAPAPVLWLLHAGWSRQVAWRRVAITAMKIGGVSALMSAWWIAMLSVQGKFGADVLGYSESLEAVSLTANSPEVLRGMGYWLFYVRDPIGFATTASFDYMTSGRLIAIGFAVLLIGLVGIVATRWTSRLYAAMLVFVGVVLAVGVHPIEDASPLMSPFAHNSRSSIALALRSSTRALPLSTFGIALGAGAVVTAISRTRWRPRRLAPWIAGGLAVANLPVLWNGGMVDPNLERDQDPPAAWSEAVDHLDAAPDGYRVFELPGQEFGAFRWGYTVDPPLPGLTEEPLVTRDLLPLGSAPAMDLIYALDNRFQEGIAEPAEIAPIARLLGVDTIWLPNDAAFERFRTPRPELTRQLFSTAAADGGLDAAIPFGTPTVNVPTLPMVDEQSISEAVIGTEIPPVELVPVEDPTPIMRTKTGAVVVAGSGDGLVDAAAAGLLDGDPLIRYAADLGDEPAASTASAIIVTDSNRKRATQWRSAQDVSGFTEDASGTGVLDFDSADQRIPVFPEQTTADQTIAEQRGPLRAYASSYGAPSAYLPESRAVMAIDGDLSTAWVVGDRYDARGEHIRLDADAPVGELTLVQPQDARNRWITQVSVDDGTESYTVDLDESSRAPDGQAVALRHPTTRVTITIEATANGDRLFGRGDDAVGFAEIRVPSLDPTEEVVRVPTDVPAATDAQDLDVVLTRLRTRPTNRWRSDPEPGLTRAITLTGRRSFDAEVTTRLDPRASDAAIAQLLGWAGTVADRRLTGVPAMGGWAATDGDPTTPWVTPFDGAVGSTLTIPLSGGTSGSTLQITQPPSSQFAVATEVTVSGAGGADPQTISVPPPDANGVSTITITPIAAPAIEVTITGTTDATTIDRKYSEPVQLPVAIGEVSGDGIVAARLPDRLDVPCTSSYVSVDGTEIAIRITGRVADLFAGTPATTEVCDGSLDLGPGEHIVRGAPGATTGIDVDRIVLRSAGSAPTSTSGVAAATVTHSDHTHRTVRVDACPDGCWFVFGEGWNEGWEATIDGDSLGDQQVVDGGFNGWYLPPSDQPRVIELEFTGQTTLWAGLIVSALGLLACIGLIVWDRRRAEPEPADEPSLAPLFGTRSSARITSWRSPAIVAAVVALVLGGLVIDPLWGVLCGLITFIGAGILGRPRAPGYAAIVIAMAIGAVMIRRVTSLHPFANAGWPGNFEDLHHLGMAVVVLTLSGALTSANAARASRPARRQGADR